MVDSRRKDCALHQRAQDIGKQEVRKRFQLIAGRGMSCDLQAKLAQMLHRPPHFGATGAQFLGDARSADDHGCVVAQQAHNAAQAHVGGTVWLDIQADWHCSGDKKIMREESGIAQPKISEWGRLSPASGHSTRLQGFSRERNAVVEWSLLSPTISTRPPYDSTSSRSGTFSRV